MVTLISLTAEQVMRYINVLLISQITTTLKTFILEHTFLIICLNLNIHRFLNQSVSCIRNIRDVHTTEFGI